MSETVPVVTIDGPGGTGKGTVAARIAERLGWHLLDSGAIYRVLAYAAAQAGVDSDDVEGLLTVAARMHLRFTTDGADTSAVELDGADVTTAIRSEACGDLASRVAAHPAVREALLQRQRDFRQRPGLVADGRDMGTVVFADAPVKIFLTASVEERARRRYKQLMRQGVGANLNDLLEEIAARDRRDASRSVAPLAPAADAVELDTTELSVDEVTEAVMSQVCRRLNVGGPGGSTR